MSWRCDGCKCNHGMREHRYTDSGGFEWVQTYVDCQESDGGRVWTKLAVPDSLRCPWRRKGECDG